jgi:hypothetical protein
MPVSVKEIELWRKELNNQPGTLAAALEPFRKAGADLQIVMGYRYPGEPTKAALELYRIDGKKATRAAIEAGLSASAISAILVEGDDRPGLGYDITKAIADAGINLDFLVAQVIGKKYSAVIGFDSAAGKLSAIPVIKKAAAKKKQ